MQDPNNLPPAEPPSIPPFNPPPMGTLPPGSEPQTNTMAIIGLILSVLGLVGILPIIGGILGVILGRRAKNEIAASGGTQSGAGLAQASIIVGWIGIALVAVVLICVCMVFGLGIGGSLLGGAQTR